MDYKATHNSNPDDIQHWKYIRREPNPNGPGYKYYYAETTAKDAGKSRLKDILGYDERSAYRTMKNTYKLHDDVAKYAERAAVGAIRDTKVNNFTKASTNRTIYKIARDQQIYDRASRDQTKQALDKALAEYKKTPLYKIERLKEKVNKGKKWISKKLGIH